MKKIFNRIYSDYLMPSRLAEYERLLLQARDAGFTQTSVRAFHSTSNTKKLAKKVIVHRHDIDTDLRTTRKLFDIESKHGVQASYYFRLSTLDLGFMREIEAAGSEASYHYEELATFAKKNHINDPAEIRTRLPQIRVEFEANCQSVAQRLGKNLVTVASHGDFANRRLKVSNTEILDDQQLRARCGIACETYDKNLLDHFDLYISDKPAPVYYRPIAPSEAIGRHDKIYLLTHPRQFETNWRENTKDNLYRFYEGMAW